MDAKQIEGGNNQNQIEEVPPHLEEAQPIEKSLPVKTIPIDVRRDSTIDCFPSLSLNLDHQASIWIVYWNFKLNKRIGAATDRRRVYLYESIVVCCSWYVERVIVGQKLDKPLRFHCKVHNRRCTYCRRHRLKSTTISCVNESYPDGILDSPRRMNIPG